MSTPGRKTSPIHVENTPGRPTTRNILKTTPGRPTKNSATTFIHQKTTRFRKTDPLKITTRASTRETATSATITTRASTTNRIIASTLKPKYSDYKTRYPPTGAPS